MLSFILVHSLVILTVFASPLTRNLQVHESRASAPGGYTLTGPAPPDTILSLRLALVQSDPAGLVDALYDVSTPNSTNYGNHLSKAAVEAFVAPTSESDWLLIQVPTSKANELLDAQYSVFTHTTTQKQTIRTLSYSIPPDLAGHLELVHPTISFPDPYSSQPVVDFPKCRIREMLQVHARTFPPSHPRAFNPWQWPQRTDLTTFLEELRPDISPSTTYNIAYLDGGIDPQNGSAGIESNLDIQYTVGLATDVPVTFISAPPQVMTTSYGVDEYLISEKLAYNLCAAYAQLGARGVSILFASGDGGVSGGHYPADGCTTFIPTFPSGVHNAPLPSQRHIRRGTINIPQTAVNFSGGGFSNYWARPSFQSLAVQVSRLARSTDAGLYNASGRGIPDVAAYAVDFAIVVDGAVLPVSGTSCASPTFASVVALVNDALLSAGRPVLGWLNPWLYAEGWEGLTDITTGNNYACSNFTTGFEAGVGWDPVTGLGTPDYARLTTVLGL
ncbi:subtilisin-like protein [Fomitopsis serialis]|uniref:subtilisin-like protein n=1 Tax=Fomitopsis serialis TaxID=139415 RepID=UPI002007FC13|nr:subtilisin-like protein [Neoantrodia serialis]KAH9913287.1 subtilisin-like protein [Neoantrodia serialis]